MIYTILYVSRSVISEPKIGHEVQDIVNRSVRWNATVGVTGALVSTERHFAQFIEGPESAILELMAKIERDPRHRDITVRRARVEAERRFDDWSLAYSGPDVFLEPAIAPLMQAVSPAEAERLAQNLLDLMQGFVSQR